MADLPRNISDERIRAIAQTGGIVGLQFFSVVLSSGDDRRAALEDLMRHLDHIVHVGGIDHVALGPDFLEPTLIERRPDHYAQGLEDVTGLPRVAEALIARGYADAEVRKILGENMLRIYKQVIG